MSTDFETQLRAVGTALDGRTEPVTAAEIAARHTTANVEVPQDLSVVPLRSPDASNGAGPGRRWVLSAVASVLVLGLVAAFVLLDRTQPAVPPSAAPSTELSPNSADDPASSAPVQPVQPVDASASLPAVEDIPTIDVNIVPVDSALPRADVFPSLPVGDARNAGVLGSYMQIALQNPERVTALVGRLDAGRLTGGVQIQTVNERSEDMFSGSARELLVGGQIIEVFEEPGTPTIVTAVLAGEPTITLTGLDPIAFLERADPAFATAAWSGNSGTMELDLDRLPDGYEVIVAPRPDAPPGSLIAALNVGASGGGADGAIIEVGLDNPLPYRAAVGPLEVVEVNGAVAWVNTTGPGFSVIWQATETTWASLGGVRSAEDAIAAAESLEFVDEGTWRTLYGIPEPSFGSSDGQIISIDVGHDDGMKVGMPVVNAAGLIGKVTAVTDSRSDVLLLADPRFQVAAQIDTGIRTGADTPGCLLRGRNDHLDFVCAEGLGADVSPGATLVTTGRESTSPAGIPIGTIESIRTADGEQVAVVTPFASDPALGTATVILYRPE